MKLILSYTQYKSYLQMHYQRTTYYLRVQEKTDYQHMVLVLPWRTWTPPSVASAALCRRTVALAAPTGHSSLAQHVAPLASLPSSETVRPNPDTSPEMVPPATEAYMRNMSLEQVWRSAQPAEPSLHTQASQSPVRKRRSVGFLFFRKCRIISFFIFKGLGLGLWFVRV